MTSFNDGIRLVKEATTIDQQKKQFQRTGLDTLWKRKRYVFDLKLKNLQHIHRNHSQATKI